jgi:hypothetical protein
VVEGPAVATASETIVSAYRESNLVGVGRSLTSGQEAEGLTLLNGLLPATIGSEAGEELADINIGGPTDLIALEYAPVNARLVLNLAAGRTINLHPKPHDGQRLAVVDAGGNLSTANLTLDGNGRLIEGASSLVLNTDGEAREWFYRADLGDWKRLSSLDLADDLPFPREFDDYFSILLAMRLNPRHGRELAASSMAWLQAQANRLEARYRRPRPFQDYATIGMRHHDAVDSAWAPWL